MNALADAQKRHTKDAVCYSRVASAEGVSRGVDRVQDFVEAFCGVSLTIHREAWGAVVSQGSAEAVRADGGPVREGIKIVH